MAGDEPRSGHFRRYCRAAEATSERIERRFAVKSVCLEKGRTMSKKRLFGGAVVVAVLAAASRARA